MPTCTNRRHRPLFPALLLALTLPLAQHERHAWGFGWLTKNPASKQTAKQVAGSKIQINSLPLKEGDIIFHQSRSSQSEAIRIATNSRFNHTAILIRHKGGLAVLEAVQPVKITPVEEFVRRGGGHFVIKRLRDHQAVLTPQVLQKLQERGLTYVGKNYDLYFRWDDTRIYCSELVWKLYKDITGLEIGKLQKSSDLQLDNPIVQKLIKSRYGKMAEIPVNEPIISPQSIYDSDRLITVYEQ